MEDAQDGLPRFLDLLLRRRRIALLVACAAFASSFAYSSRARPVFRAQALLDIEPIPRRTVTVPRVRGYWSEDQAYLETQYRLITNDGLLRRVYDDLKLSSAPGFSQGLESLRAAVLVSPVPYTRLCFVRAVDSDPARAMRIANTLADYFVEQNLGSQLFMSQAALKALQARSGPSASGNPNESLPAVVDNPFIQRIKAQVYTAESELANLRMKYTEDHAAVVALRSRLETMRGTLRREIDNVVQSVKTGLSGRLQGNNVRVVSPALLPRRPSAPRKRLLQLFGLFGGLSLGGFVALLAELLDRTVRCPDDLEDKLGIRFLGLIPRARRGAKALSPSPKNFLTGEAFRNLRTMVGLASGAEREPALLVTSAVQGEGKSYVASHLGAALSQLEGKVLLIDGDMRRPRQHRNLRLSMDKGLSDYLSGRVSDPAALVQKTALAGLEAIPCGPRRAHPTELLDTGRLADLVDWARGRYARVIVDCPSVFPASDVLLWGRHIRLALLVTRFQKTRVPRARAACARLRGGGVQVLGGVVNDANLNALGYPDGRGYERRYRGHTESRGSRRP